MLCAERVRVAQSWGSGIGDARRAVVLGGLTRNEVSRFPGVRGPSPYFQMFLGSSQPPNVLRLPKTVPRRLRSWDSDRPPSDHWPLIVHCSVLSALLLPPLPIRFTWCPHSNSGCCCGLWHRTKPHPFAVSLRILTCYFHSLQISPNPQEYSWSTALD